MCMPWSSHPQDVYQVLFFAIRAAFITPSCHTLRGTALSHLHNMVVILRTVPRAPFVLLCRALLIVKCKLHHAFPCVRLAGGQL